MKERDAMKKNEADRERRASAAKSGKDEKAGDRKGATERRSPETRMCGGRNQLSVSESRSPTTHNNGTELLRRLTTRVCVCV